ncbi:MAG TPA: exodeoxyribonuclease III [Acidobacteriota bacterium]|nr:exodeoxyribonuclease III [Acidobacteriota bacterium]
MRIATWNINGLNARMDFVLHWLRARQPDVVGLQELKTADEKFPHMAFQSEGYHAVAHGQKAWNGVAILSREPCEVLQVGLPGQGERGARLLTARIGELDFTTIYLPNGKTLDHEDFPKKLAWLEALIVHMATTRSEDAQAVLCGDFNICPAAIDSWNENALRGTIFHTDEERNTFRRLLDGGFVDLFRQRYPDEQKFSWWDYRGGAFHRGMGLRIDFLLGTPSVVARTEEVWVDREYRKKKDGLIASDHAPVIAELS